MILPELISGPSGYPRGTFSMHFTATYHFSDHRFSDFFAPGLNPLHGRWAARNTVRTAACCLDGYHMNSRVNMTQRQQHAV